MEARALTTLVESVRPRAWRGDSPFHGEEHWRCVAATGLTLAPTVGNVDATIVFCFGLLHDTRRVNEAVDPEHGERAAAFAAELREDGVLSLADARFDVLAAALAGHSNGLVSSDPTTGTCWDADRLHLPRVAIQPRPDLLSTVAARGPAPLAAAAALRRDGPPAWNALVALVAGAEGTGGGRAGGGGGGSGATGSAGGGGGAAGGAGGGGGAAGGAGGASGASGAGGAGCGADADSGGVPGGAPRGGPRDPDGAERTV